MKKVLLVALTLGMLAGPGLSPGEANNQKQLNRIMVDKLKNSQKLLEGIALADFNKIASSAEELIQLSRTAEWLVLKTPRYEVHSNEFRRAAEVIIQKARAKNIDGTALAYLELTMSCVRCHQYVREVREARGPARAGDMRALAFHP